MKKKNVTKHVHLQWHPAFYAGIQIEFEEDSKELIFENEHQLGTKPKEVDILITKKNNDYQVKKNIGKIFRKYNLIEFKPPGDSLNIDDFYQVCGYGCFYKANSAFVNSIKIEEITLTFIVHSYPREMIKNLKAEKRYNIVEVDRGIYYIEGGVFPIQLVVTRYISEQENFWLWNLNNKLKTTKHVYEKYQKHRTNKLYKSVMDIIVKTNRKLFKEEEKMCQALYELFEDELMEMVEKKAEERAVELAEEKVAKLAEEKAVIKAIEALVNNAHFTLEQALNILMLSEEERATYSNLYC